MKNRLNILLSGLELLALQGRKTPQGGRARQPNVIYVFPGQYRNQAMEFWDQEGFRERVNFWNDPVHTPRLNDFARESMVLTSAMSNCPLSNPHRGSLLTGMYPNKNDVPLNYNSSRPISSLCANVDCVSDVFSGAGYDCAHFGKLHTDSLTPSNPQRPGKYVEDRIPAWGAYTPEERRYEFNYWYSYGTFDEHKNPHYWDTDGKRHDPREWSPLHGASGVVSCLRNENNVRDPGRPFLIMVGMNPSHSPYHSLDDCMEQNFSLYKDRPLDSPLVRPDTDPEMAKAKSARYYFTLVTDADRAFEQVLDTLEKLGLDENTIVVFSSDRGETMRSQHMNDPKNSPFSESVNVPFIVRFPDKIKPRLDGLILPSPDIMPTLLGLAELSDSIPATVQGHSYAPLFLDGKAGVVHPTGTLYIQSPDGEEDADSKIRSCLPASRGFKSAHYMLALYIDRDSRRLVKSLLFDDRDDPYQMSDLSLEENKDIVGRPYAEMGRVLKEIDDPWYRERILSDMIPCGE